MWEHHGDPELLRVTGVKPLAGRLLQPEDDKIRGGHPVMVLIIQVGERALAETPILSGAKIQVNGREFSVLGELPPKDLPVRAYDAPEIYFSWLWK